MLNSSEDTKVRVIRRFDKDFRRKSLFNFRNFSQKPGSYQIKKRPKHLKMLKLKSPNCLFITCIN